MRLIHTSDWHLGRRLHGQDLLEAQAEFLGWLLELARAEQADAVLVSGDVYDRAQPGADAVELMDRTLGAFAQAGVPLIVSSGNHDSAVRLQYGGSVFARAGIHLRTEVGQVDDPILLADAAGHVAIYGIPFVLPDAVLDELGVERSHAAVLGALTDRIRRDLSQRGIQRSVVMAHAFVTGASASESEREIRVGGVGDTPARVFDGFSYVALGHLHGPQDVLLHGSSTVIGYSGSPLAFSFSERQQVKSVTVVDIDPHGAVSSRRVSTPVPRPLRQVTGRLAELLTRSDGELADIADAWLKVVLTDPGRVVSPMEQLRDLWPHTLVLEFAPDGPDRSVVDLVHATESMDPVEICAGFVTTVGGDPPTRTQIDVLRDAVLAAQRQEVST